MRADAAAFARLCAESGLRCQSLQMPVRSGCVAKHSGRTGWVVMPATVRYSLPSCGQLFTPKLIGGSAPMSPLGKGVLPSPLGFTQS